MEYRSAWLETLGCQMNEADSERMAGILRAEGYRMAAAPEEADVILINTCSIRDRAEQKAFSLAGRFGQIKRRRPGTLLVFAGCVAQQLGSRVLERLPAVDAVVGTRRCAALPALLARVRDTGRPVVDTGEGEEGEHPARPLRASRVKAWVSVMFGCDNRCAYCVVPLVRGRERSRRPVEVLAEVAALGSAGYREVTLLGQNVNSYGRGLEPAADFAGLLRAIDGSAGIPRVRFTTSHPKDFSAGLMRALRDLPSACEAVHLPLQAGSDAVLRRMNRGYTLEDYRRIIGRLRETVPGVAVSTDIIVGFPGESAADFGCTLDALEELRFDAIFSFRYSPRAGTAAATMADAVADEVKASRLVEVQSLQRGVTEELNRRLVGEQVEVLVEGHSRRSAAEFTGRTRTNKIVNFSAEVPPSPGDFVSVRITGAGFLSLQGRRSASVAAVR
ncbi:MAG TPA: tRNA (N6-isopentenyl adenosine(37)-C2)-methylthiotransferase MiaB [Candidatus Methanoperedens sp.]|nr:tRNA (N6-isopentenyl adenosine(37)-C2)-methylthiotransferase MiaB [Candidatus Methanoperedens sp.]